MRNYIPRLFIVIPCYNEQDVLPITSQMFLDKMHALIDSGLITENSKILFVNDGSKDDTWKIIKSLAEKDNHYTGITLSRNCGHQNALLAGLMEAKDYCDISISIDCDGQDDINAMDEMVKAFDAGSEIVYGVRSSRMTDTWFKRTTAQGFYRFLNRMGAEAVYNHADYRLVSSKVLQHFADYHEVNIFLRGMFPLVGFKSSVVSYERHERIAGKSHYPLKKMIALAFEGITSLSIKPITLIVQMGILATSLGLVGIVWFIIATLTGHPITGLMALVSLLCFLCGVQLTCLGIVGEYVGKTYLESKHRPRYIISAKTFQDSEGL